jgi:hypothetical protein
MTPPMPTATVLPTATATREPTFTVAGLAPDQYPPARLANEVIAQYAKAVNLKPETIALKSLQMKDQQGKPFVVATTMDSTPLLIAEQKAGSGELLWQVATDKRLAETRNMLIGSFFGANNVTH